MNYRPLLNTQSFVCTLSPSRNSVCSVHWVDSTWQLEYYRSALSLDNLIKLRSGCLPILLRWDKALPASTHLPCHSWSHTNPIRFLGIQSRNGFKWNTEYSLHQNPYQSQIDPHICGFPHYCCYQNFISKQTLLKKIIGDKYSILPHSHMH